MRAAALGLALLAAATTAAAAETINLGRVAVAGQSIVVLQAAALAEDCSNLGPMRYSVVASPGHGKLTIRNARIFVAYSDGQPRAACFRKEVDGTQLTYVPDRSYAGKDVLEVEQNSPFGTTRRFRIEIAVRGLAR